MNGILTYAVDEQIYLDMSIELARSAKSVLGLTTTVVTNLETSNTDAEFIRVPDCDIRPTWSDFEYIGLSYSLSPYDTTFLLDADNLIVAGSHLYLPEHQSVSSGVACDLNGRPATTEYRTEAQSVGLPDAYVNCMAFRKDNIAEHFWSTYLPIYRSWYVLPEWKGAVRIPPPSTDLVLSVMFNRMFGSAVPGNRFIHMKPGINGWSSEFWSDLFELKLTRGYKASVNGLNLKLPLHLYEKRVVCP